MNAVVFYSNTGQSESVAKYFAKQLNYPIVDIDRAGNMCYQNLVLVFPVHCQNIPDVVKSFLKSVKVRYLTVIATYGKMCFGNVIYEIQKKYCKNVVAGAYIPTKHSYVEDDGAFIAFDRLASVVEKIQNPCKTEIPRSYKNPFANLFPKLRSRLGLRIYKNTACNNCGACTERCNFNAIKSGVTDNKCIRCLKCVTVCPNNALEFKLSLPLKLYLRKKKVNKIIIYV